MSRRLRPKETVLFDVEMSAPKRNSPVWCRDVCTQTKQSCLMSRSPHARESVFFDVSHLYAKKNMFCLMMGRLRAKKSVLFSGVGSALKKVHPVWCRMSTLENLSYLMPGCLYERKSLFFFVRECVSANQCLAFVDAQSTKSLFQFAELLHKWILNQFFM